MILKGRIIIPTNRLVLCAHAVCFTSQLAGDISLYYGHHLNGLCHAQKLLTKFKINDWLTEMYKL
jgi:hypothetical protein